MSFSGGKNAMGIKNPQKKATLAKKGRQTKWAPVWIILKKFGKGKRTKLHIKPRRQRKSHFG